MTIGFTGDSVLCLSVRSEILDTSNKNKNISNSKIGLCSKSNSSWLKTILIGSLFATVSGNIYQNCSTQSAANPYEVPREVISKIFNELENIPVSFLEENNNEFLSEKFGEIYSGPVTDIEEIAKYLPEGSSIKIERDSTKELFISKSGVPIVLDHIKEWIIPYEALYAAFETIDMLMSRVEPHVRERILNTKLFVYISLGPDQYGSPNDHYTGWYKLAGRTNLRNNQISIGFNTILPRVPRFEEEGGYFFAEGMKPGTSKMNTLIHEFTHAVQGLLPYRATQDGPLENWNHLTEFPPRIWNAIKKQIDSEGFSPTDIERVNQWVSDAASIEGLSEDDVLLAKDIVFNKKVQNAYMAALTNHHYQKKINPKARFGDYQLKEDPTCSWISKGPEYFSELVAGAFGMNKEYSFPSGVGRMANPKWIQDNDPLGWDLVIKKFHMPDNNRFCTMPLLDTLPFCQH